MSNLCPICHGYGSLTGTVGGTRMWWDCPACGGAGTLYKMSLTPPTVGGKPGRGNAAERIREVINRQEKAMREGGV